MRRPASSPDGNGHLGDPKPGSKPTGMPSTPPRHPPKAGPSQLPPAKLAPPLPIEATAKPFTAGSSKGHALTPAEAYASAHQLNMAAARRDRTGKPIFEWITRKLAPNRRVVSDAPIQRATRKPNPVVKIPTPPNQSPPKPVSPAQIFTPLSGRESIRSENHSLKAYSYSRSTAFVSGPERERRREANNPYPFIPVGPHRQSTIDSESHAPSMSFVSRSRSSSMRSEGSMTSGLPRRRISMLDDASSRLADEDASIRPIPPSHPNSPTPSASFVYLSASASLLSPRSAVSPLTFLPPSPSFARPYTRYSVSSPGPAISTSSSEPDEYTGGHSRQESLASTKPTTVLSFDSGPRPAHIAQAPPFVSVQVQSEPTTSDLLLDTAPDSPGPANANDNSADLTRGSSSTSPAFLSHPLVQAPKHSHPHPRDNPHPTSPPDANASILTLASSTYAATPGAVSPGVLTPAPGPPSLRLRDALQPVSPHFGPGVMRTASLLTSPSVTFAPEPLDRPSSIYGGREWRPDDASTSARSGWPNRIDEKASVRAIRRKGSWDSIESGWSWRAQSGSAMLAAMASGTDGDQSGMHSPIANLRSEAASTTSSASIRAIPPASIVGIPASDTPIEPNTPTSPATASDIASDEAERAVPQPPIAPHRQTDDSLATAASFTSATSDLSGIPVEGDAQGRWESGITAY